MTVQTPSVHPMRTLAQRNDELQKENDALREIIEVATHVLATPDRAPGFHSPWLLVEEARRVLDRAGSAW